jgi:mxaJ protein
MLGSTGSSRVRRWGGLPVGILTLAIGLIAVAATSGSSRKALRVCADPNNLPFSNQQKEGFENHLASLIGAELKEPVEYTWWAQRRGFFRSTVNAGVCDLVIGVPSSLEMVRRTKPYYRSGYVFVTRRDRKLRIMSLDDSVLRRLRIGVPMIGDDYAATPPAAALIARGMSKNIVSFSVYGDYATPNPPARLIDAVRDGTVDVAIAWGPLAGYFARAPDSTLAIAPVVPQIDLPFLPLAFDISMGVRRGDSLFAMQLDRILERRRESIDSLLASYGVPRLDRVNAAIAGRDE